MNAKIAVIPGDGVGPEVVTEAVRVLDCLPGYTFQFTELPAGGNAIETHGQALPPATLEACRGQDAVLLGAVGGWQWDSLPGDQRPEQALLGLRAGLGLYANLRPARLIDSLQNACPLRPSRIPNGVDLMVVRELTGGIYFGQRGRKQTPLGEAAWDTEQYAEEEVRRVALRAFQLARQRRHRLTSVDKANVLESSRLWRQVVCKVAADFPDVELEHLYVDNAAMQLIRDPAHFDVIVTGNMFGDILSDEASQIVGSIGLLPSASLGAGTFGMYEPVHGSAPDIAGKNIANPIAAILSAAMMLRHTFGDEPSAITVELSVQSVLTVGYRTADIMPPYDPDDLPCALLTTQEMGDKIVDILCSSYGRRAKTPPPRK